MSQRAKLIAKVRHNPKDVAFGDACRLAELLGFKAKGQKGSHCAFSRPGEQMLLNFQNHKGKIKFYQARQLIDMIDKYGDDDCD